MAPALPAPSSANSIPFCTWKARRNDVSVEGIGFDAEENAGSFLTAGGAVELPVMSKARMADRILDEVAKLRG